MEREIDPRLQELFDKGIQPTSISRCGTINGCEVEAYYTYKKKIKGRDSIYGLLGSKVHNVLEDIVDGNADESDLLPAMQDELESMDMLGIEFPKIRGEDIVKQAWVDNMTHFCNTYKSPRGSNLSTEQFFLYKTDKDIYLQGYIDLQKKNSDGTISIYDYKTSAMYKADEWLEHGRQLVIYQLGLEQAGEKVKNVAWIFLKYLDVTFMGKKTAKAKNLTEIKKTVERRKLAKDLSKYVERDLYDLGYDEIDSEIMLGEFLKANSFDVLPEEIQKKYKVRPCVVEYEVTDEIKQECIDYVNNTMIYWNSKGDDLEEYSHRSFTKLQKNGKEVPDYFYCTSLCGHFERCPYIHDYLNTLQEDKKDDEFDDLF